MSFSNALSAFCFAVGSFFLGIWFDFIKDDFKNAATEAAHIELLNSYILKGSLVACGFFWVVGILILAWRFFHWKGIKIGQLQ